MKVFIGLFDQSREIIQVYIPLISHSSTPSETVTQYKLDNAVGTILL